MGLPISGSPNISEFDYSVQFNLNAKTISLEDISTYIGGGANNVHGINFRIVSPSGIVITNNTNFSSPDIDPAAPAAFIVNMPTINGAVQYGFYIIEGTLEDADDTQYELEKRFNVCKPPQCDGTRGSDGCLDVSITFKCFDNKVLYVDNTSYVYRDTDASDIDYDVTVIDPNNVEQVSNADTPSFTIAPIVNGRYSFTIENTATYEFDDEISVIIVYKLTNKQYTAACDVNLCDAACAIDGIYEEWQAEKGSGSSKEKLLKEKWERLAFLIAKARIEQECGVDSLSETIEEIEELADVECSCGCGSTNTNTPLTPSQDILIEEGCGDITIEQTTAGNTVTFTISDVTDAIEVDPFSAEMLTAETTEDECLRTTVLNLTGKVIADSTDTCPDYLIAKFESSDDSVIIELNEDGEGCQTIDLRTHPIVLFNDQTDHALTNVGNFNTITVPAETVADDGDILELETFFSSSAAVGDSPQIDIKFNGVAVIALGFGASVMGIRMTMRIHRTSAAAARIVLRYDFYTAPSLTIYPSSGSQFFIPPTTVAVNFDAALAITTNFTVDSATGITVTNSGLSLTHFRKYS